MISCSPLKCKMIPHTTRAHTHKQNLNTPAFEQPHPPAFPEFVSSFLSEEQIFASETVRYLPRSLAMYKTRNLPVRLEKELIDKIEEEAEHEKTDKSTVIRKLIAPGIQENAENTRTRRIQKRQNHNLEGFRQGRHFTKRNDGARTSGDGPASHITKGCRSSSERSASNAVRC